MWWLELLASATTLWMMWGYGDKIIYGPEVGLASNLVWLFLILSSGQWGLLPLNIGMWVITFRNLRKWNREQ